jgi:triacylglycerol lipase
MRRDAPGLIPGMLAGGDDFAYRATALDSSVNRAMNPIVLVHGIGDTARLFRHMAAGLEREGRAVYALDLVPNNGEAGIDELAGQLAAYIGAKFSAGRLVDLVGFSMGGLVCRYYLQRMGGLARVRRFIAIASPHRGTWTAHLRGNRGARQMRPGSDFLRDLNADVDALKRIAVTSVWTPFDLMILPARSAVLGRSIRVHVPAHALMARDRRVGELVQRLLCE